MYILCVKHYQKKKIGHYPAHHSAYLDNYIQMSQLDYFNQSVFLSVYFGNHSNITDQYKEARLPKTKFSLFASCFSLIFYCMCFSYIPLSLPSVNTPTFTLLSPSNSSNYNYYVNSVLVILKLCITGADLVKLVVD